MPSRSRIETSSSLSSADFARVQARRRLVEAEQLRVGAHRPRDLEPPLRAIGQLAGRPVGIGDEPDALQPAARLVDRRAPRRAR